MRVSSAFSRRVASDSSSEPKRTNAEPSPRPSTTSATIGGLKAHQAEARPSLRLTPSDANLFSVLHARQSATSLTSDLSTHLLTHAAFIHSLSFDQLLTGHTGCVNRLAWNATATLLASGSDDCCVRLWDMTKPGRPCRLNLQTGHQANIFAVGFLQNDTSIVSAGMDCSVRVCRIDREECIGVYNCHQARVKELCVDPLNDNVFLTAGEDGTCRQFDMRAPHHCAAAPTTGRRMFMHRESAGTAPCANALVSTPSLQAKCVDINPLLPQYFLLSANDHYIRVFDRRYLPPSRSATASSPAYASFAAAHLKRGHQSTFSQWDETGRQIVASYSGEQVYVYEFDRRADDDDGSRYKTYSKTGERAEQELKQQYEEEKMEEVEVDWQPTPARTSTLPTLNLDTAFPTRITATCAAPAFSVAASSSSTPPAVMPPEVLARAEQLTSQGNSEYEQKDYSAAIASYNSALLLVSPNQPTLTSRILALRSTALTARHYPSDLHLALDDAMHAYRVDRQNERALVGTVDGHRKLGRLSRAMRLCHHGLMHVRGGEVEREMSAMMDEMREERKKKAKEHKKAAESKAAGARGRRREQREKHKEKEEERKHRRTKRSKSSATATATTTDEKERDREKKRRKALRTESEDDVRAMETEVTSTEESEAKRTRRMNRGRSEERKERGGGGGGGRGGKEEKEREEKDERAPMLAEDAFDELMMDTLRMTREQWTAKYGDDEDEDGVEEEEEGEDVELLSDNEPDFDADLQTQVESALEGEQEAADEEEEDEEEDEDDDDDDDGAAMSDLEQEQEAEVVDAIARRRPARRVADKEHETSSQSASSLSDTPLPLPPPVPTAPPSSSATSAPPIRTRVHRSFLQRYLGHANVQTDIKESTFWGPYILSGSDDGHIFIWERSSARLVCVIKASDDVINCVRGHPYSSVIASSGIDSEVHVWSVKPRPEREEGEVGRAGEAERPRADGRGQVDKERFVQLVDSNQRRMERDVSVSPSTLLSYILQTLGRQSGLAAGHPMAILQMLNTGEVIIRPARGGGGEGEGEEEEEEEDEDEGGEGGENEDDEDEGDDE